MESSYRVSENGLLLECNTRGLPSTATLWNKDGVLLSSLEDQFVVSSSLLLSDQRQAHYGNSLTITDPTVFGVMSCDVHSDWVTADKRNSGRKSKLKINGHIHISHLVLSMHTNKVCLY